MTEEKTVCNEAGGGLGGKPIQTAGCQVFQYIRQGGGNWRKGLLQELPVLVALDADKGNFHQAFGGSLRLERAEKGVAQVNDLIQAAPGDIGQNGFERPDICMYIG
jgi:hypothetical protein